MAVAAPLHFHKNNYIGADSYINGGMLVASPNVKIVIGRNCLVSYNVHIRTDMQNYIDATTLITDQGFTEKDIIIGDDVWIGYGAKNHVWCKYCRWLCHCSRCGCD